MFLIINDMNNLFHNLRKTIVNCKKCPIILQSRNKPVPGFGKEDAKIMLIGLAPGRDGADMTGIPFTRDPSGLLIDEMLRNAGISRELDVYITNLVKCNPKDNKGRNRPPSNVEINACWPYLKEEIELMNPKIIIPLGKKASELFIRDKKTQMNKIHGKIYNIDNKVVIPFIHPSYVIRGAYDKSTYLNEFKSIGKFFFKLIENDSKLSRFDFLLMILKNSISNNIPGEIVGKTRLQKYIFLAQNNLINSGYKAKYAFRPYYYGPFNRQLYTDIEWLRMNNLIEIKSVLNFDGCISKYTMTEKGIKLITKMIQKYGFEEIDKIINNALEEYHHYPISSLVEYVHEKYSEYDLKNFKNKKIGKYKKLDKFFIKKEI